ncbi:MAG: tRNA (adenosine(37)-N6)-threonylcarbamoyltransferase complex dimerization subunit type 1 TsaB [Altererythrobacter sp.]|nr:tRNA (adenosine(37)-N6)-threonylcarbamoyltransferase complex dimerization subunit type 1 TsaB [Altererythrobacter sp.]NNE50312.1 tRNA (adenosine(37)-N6)-threonylcarbamoyltransferase complex dimerization subunit type 1 TsaB [Altererythrobacter sp.]NNK46742.1 tRNA (adenosine(37)-N6)-threonylcarbamoyltransferase complex dimerization subunit type 1 TsaB [Altererythrobacter sp.]
MRTPKRTLAIETATEACSVALFEGDQLLAGQHVVLGRGHAERLVPMIEALPDNGKADRILVSLGPGSFTGVRIGIAAARALGLAWGADVLGYPTLSLLATMAQNVRADAPIMVCMNGGHGEWFVQSYSLGSNPEGEVQSLSPDEAAAICKHQVIAGNRAQEMTDLLGGQSVALNILPDARKTYLLRETHLTTNLAPIYGRGPDAKLPVG